MLNFSSNEHPLGSYLNNQQKLYIQAKMIGTTPLESLQLFEGRNIIAEVHPTEFEDLQNSNHICSGWQGSKERGWQRRVTWNGTPRQKFNYGVLPETSRANISSFLVDPHL